MVESIDFRLSFSFFEESMLFRTNNKNFVCIEDESKNAEEKWSVKINLWVKQEKKLENGERWMSIIMFFIFNVKHSAGISQIFHMFAIKKVGKFH